MIFNFFKSKPTLKELIPKGFIDIHSHILPGIDDGPKNSEESLELISEIKKLGFSKAIGTPHTYPRLYNNTNLTIENSYKQLTRLTEFEILIDYASEYMIDISLIKKAEEKSLLCLKENFVLVEMSFLSMPNNFYEIIFQIQTNGYKVILAHPERYSFMFRNYKDYFRLKDLGCKFQLNLLSLVGYYGKETLQTARKLINDGLIDYLGSDIHSKAHVKEFGKNVIIPESKKVIEISENNLFFS